jgi:3-methyladenine DNA glycosylase AlkD
MLNQKLQNSADKKFLNQELCFFKTNQGSYAQKDFFMGIRVPVLRKIARDFLKSDHFPDFEQLNLNRAPDFEQPNLYSSPDFERRHNKHDYKLHSKYKDFKGIIKIFLFSKWHEKRLFSLILITEVFKKYQKNFEKNLHICKDLYSLYLNCIDQVNNWDLVDLSAPAVSGAWLYEFSNYKNKGKYLWYPDFDILNTLAHSKNLWKKRISIVSTLYFIKKGFTDKTYEIAEILLNDPHDLIHKATGWMLREAGKIDIEAEKDFLKKNYYILSRTCLRYAIEKFPEPERKKWLKNPV